MARFKLCILGGTGFVGRCLAARLSAVGHHITILTRYRARHRDLLVLPTTVLHEGDVYDSGFLRREFEGKDVVINLVGILNERSRAGQTFQRAHVELPTKIVEACRLADVKRLLHMSALKAAHDAPSQYLRTKAAGEELVLNSTGEELHVTSFRPSVIFGQGDSFINRFAGLLRLAPGMFPLACPNARFQPVYVEDVVQAFIAVLGEYRTFGQRYNLCGPKQYTLHEIVAYIADLMRRPTRIVDLSERLSRLQATILEFVPGKPFSLDNYLSLQVASICNGDGSELVDVFGIPPTPMEEVVPGYVKKTECPP